MVDLLQVGKVQYVWNEEDGDRSPLCYLYFCKYCLDIKSPENLQHEVDSHFCSQSLDGVPTTEAILKKNKSSNCWACPACPHTLSTRATTLLTPDPQDPNKQVAKKSYYQACSFCRWSSREVGIDDMPTASGGWNEKPIPNSARINEVIDYYKFIAQKEKQENRNSKRRVYKSLTMQLQHRYGGSKSTGRKPHPASPINALAARMKDQQELKPVEIQPSVPKSIENIDLLPEEVYTQQIDFTKISSIDKRLSEPEHQSAYVEDYYPRRANMFIKRSLRCKKCEHNLIKPEYHPSSIKFKMELVAIHYVPEIRICEIPKLEPGVKNKITLAVINRTDHATTVTLSPLFSENVPYKPGNAQCELPTTQLIVAPFHDADADFSGEDQSKKMQDDPQQIAFRQGNKLGFYIWCAPGQDMKEGEDVWISFCMKYDHQSNMAVLLQQKMEAEPEISWLCHKVYVNLGKVKRTG